MVMVAAALWATVGVAVQVTPEARNIPEMVLAAARTGIAGPMLLAVWAVGSKGRLAEVWRLSPGPLVVFAVASAVFQVCLFRCFALLGVTAAVFLTVCLPPVLAWSWAALRGTGGLWVQSAPALALALAGMALVSLGGRGADVPGGMPLAGVVSGVFASIAFVAMSFAASALSRRSRPILVAGTGLTLSAIILGGLACGLGGVGFAGVWTGHAGSGPVMLVVYLGLMPTALAYLCYCTGMARCRTPVVGLVASMIEPLLAAALAALLLGERVSPTMTAGCALLLGAMVVLWRSERGAGSAG